MHSCYVTPVTCSLQLFLSLSLSLMTFTCSMSVAQLFCRLSLSSACLMSSHLWTKVPPPWQKHCRTGASFSVCDIMGLMMLISFITVYVGLRVVSGIFHSKITIIPPGIKSFREDNLIL